MLIKLVIISCLFCGLQAYQSRGHFTIVAPGTVRSNTDYHVSVSLDDFRQSSWFNITLKTLTSGFESIIDNATIEVEPKTSQLIRFRVPKLYYGHGLLTVKGYRGILFLRTARIRVEEREYTSYIQTDKSKYQPGDLVQFRVIFIDRQMRPAKVDDDIDVCIYDEDRNLIRKFSSAKLMQGVLKGNVQLSDHPVLGKWSIEVVASELVLEVQSFEVARYVLPNFSVSIILKKDIAVEEGKLDINVKARYTYDQPVNGSLAFDLFSPYNTRSYSKIIEFNGENNISIDLQRELYLRKSSFSESRKYYAFDIRATVTEALTGESKSETAEVRIHSHPFNIKVDGPKLFGVNESISIKVSVTDLQGHPIQDKINPVTVKIEYDNIDLSKLNQMMESNPDFFFEMRAPIERTIYLNEDGVGLLTMTIPDNELFSECKVRAEYLEYVSDPTTLEKNHIDDSLNMKVLSESHKIGEYIEIEISSAQPIQYFIYEVISRGDIIESNRVTVPENSTTHQLKIITTYSMVPKITVFVHQILNGVLSSRSKEISIEKTFENSITILADDEALPGADVFVNVTTDSGSYVGLLGIDERVLINLDSENSLDEDSVYKSLHEYDSMTMDDDVFPGQKVGLITLSNARNKDGEEIGRVPLIVGAGAIIPMADSFEKPLVELPRIRKMFSEAWMFKDFESTPEEGFRICESIPDTITTWAITGFSLNPSTGLTLTKNVTKLKVFRDFFISLDLPSVIKQGETVEIPVYISNYLDRDILANVTIESSSEVDILEQPNSNSTIQTNRTHKQSIKSKGKERLVFFVRPQKSGRYNITVKAISSQVNDAIQKTLTVEPNGIRYSKSKTHFIFLESNQDREDEILIEIPENIVPESEIIQLSVAGSIFGPLMRSIQGLVRVPFGNSENNMRYFVTNLLVLKYLEATNQSNPSLESKAKLHMQLGYQTQLSFKHLDGSFSLFDRTAERTGDKWLTAYTIWAFQQAKTYIQIDKEVIVRGLDYLRSIQAENGGFNSGGGTDDDVALSAFVMLVFLVEEKSSNPYQDVITKGLGYLNGVIGSLERPSLKAISTYALVLGKHRTSGELLAKLSSQKSLRTKHLEWTKPDTLESSLETTTYSLMSLLESQNVSLPTLYPILQSLISLGQDKRTHAHMLALEAMIKFAQHIDFESKNLTVHLTNDQDEFGDLHVTESLQIVQLNRTSRRVKLRTTGKGFALVSIQYKYNIIPESQGSSKYETNVTMKEVNDWTLSLKICVATRTQDDPMNLVVMDAKLPSGYTVHGKSLDHIKESNNRVKFIEIIESDQLIRVYLDDVSRNGTCIKVGCSKTASVFNSKPILIHVYDLETENQTYHKIEEIDRFTSILKPSQNSSSL